MTWVELLDELEARGARVRCAQDPMAQAGVSTPVVRSGAAGWFVPCGTFLDDLAPEIEASREVLSRVALALGIHEITHHATWAPSWEPILHRLLPDAALVEWLLTPEPVQDANPRGGAS